MTVSTAPIKSPRKLIEVALPLDAINIAAAKEKSIRHGHPSTLHLWWARRPLAAARAVIFAQLVNDPGYQQGGGFKYGKNKKEAAIERQRLFRLIEELVLWENTTNESVLDRARAEIKRSWREVCELNKDHPQAAELFNPDILPAMHDPFAGGGAIPLEAQRLGLEAHASDLNPVAVLINKAMIEIPPKFAGHSPVGPLPAEEKTRALDLPKGWPGAAGLAEDVRRYGAWMREEAYKRIGHLYPPVHITAEMAKSRTDLKPLVGQNLTVIAWIWARTVMSPNPAFSHVSVPLATTFVLSSREGKEVYVQPVIEGDRYRFTIKNAAPPPESQGGTTAGKRKAFRCLISNAPIDYDYIRTEGKAGRIGQKLMAVVADGANGRVYLEPTAEIEAVAATANPDWEPEVMLPNNPRDFKTPLYGLNTFGDLFTRRQLMALTTLSDLVAEARNKILEDAINAKMDDDGLGLDAGGKAATAYAEAVSVFLGLAVSRSANSHNSLVVWSQGREQSVNLFSRQAIPMAWDFPEVSPFARAAGDFGVTTTSMARSIENVSAYRIDAFVTQSDAQTQTISSGKFISTDPPYYDNIGYADLSDFFYVWLRRSLRQTFPALLATIAVPKAEELVATPYRHGSKENAESFFLKGMTQAMERLASQSHPSAPITIYYAFKQAETDNDAGTSSTGWESFLEAVFRSGLQLTGTWPMRTERPTGVKVMTNSLASSIILVCRKRPTNATTISRREFIRELNGVLPEALDEMTKGSGEDRSPVAPVDLSQAIIGPGMAVFSKYAAVLEADGSPMSIRTALQLINRFLAEDDFDHDTQFCLHWFEQHGWGEGLFGEAETLSRAKGTSVDGVKEAGVVEAGGGKVRLLKWAEYPDDWNPSADTRLPVWEALHQIIRALRQGGESASGALLATLGGKAEAVRQLAYRLYTLCERLGQAEDARAYNELITSWTGIESAAASAPKTIQQDTFDFEK
jgi:putative DNA methylase